MHKQYVVASYRIFFGALVFAAILAQLINGLQRTSFSVVNFFSFFTIESNIFAASLFLLTAIFIFLGKQTIKFTQLRGAAALYMITTGIVYTLLLSGLETSLQTTLPWVNAVLHYVFPVIVALDWFCDPPKKRLPTQQVLLWFVFPVLYVTYSLARGHITNWYPYPFLNPDNHGYISVAVTSICIAGSMALLLFVLQKLHSKN